MRNKCNCKLKEHSDKTEAWRTCPSFQWTHAIIRFYLYVSEYGDIYSDPKSKLLFIHFFYNCLPFLTFEDDQSKFYKINFKNKLITEIFLGNYKLGLLNSKKIANSKSCVCLPTVSKLLTYYLPKIKLFSYC